MSYLNIYDWYLDYEKRVSARFLFPCSLAITSRKPAVAAVGDDDNDDDDKEEVL